MLNKNSKKLDKEKEQLWKEFEKLKRKWGYQKTSDVLYALYKKALTGKASYVKLWLKIVEGWSEKK